MAYPLKSQHCAWTWPNTWQYKTINVYSADNQKAEAMESYDEPIVMHI